jgi:hypothetical protein
MIMKKQTLNEELSRIKGMMGVVNEQTADEEQAEYDFLYKRFSDAYRAFNKLSKNQPGYESAQYAYKDANKDLRDFKTKVNKKRLRIPEILSVLRKHGMKGAKDNSSQKIGMYSEDTYKFFNSITEFTIFASQVVVDEILEDLRGKGINVEQGSWSRGWGGGSPGVEIKIISDVPLL